MLKFAVTKRYCSKRGSSCVQHRLAAIDSGAPGNFYPSTYLGENHNPLAPKVIVGCANDAAIKSKAQDTIRYKKIPNKAKICNKFDEITTPLVLVSQLCKSKLTVTFNDKGVLVNNSEGETVMRGHLDLGSNLCMVPADDQYNTKHPNTVILLKYLITEHL